MKNISRGHLVHVLPDLRVGGCYAMILATAGELKSYAHTLLTECDFSTVAPDLLWGMQASGIDVKAVDQITCEHLDEDYTGAILYNVKDKPLCCDFPVPTIYYSYGICDEKLHRGTNVTVACSNYATLMGRSGPYEHSITDTIIPPMVQTRSLRRLKSAPHPFTVGIFTSGAYDKYPCTFVREALYKLPEDIRVLLSTMPKYNHLGMGLSIDDRARRCPGKLLACQVRPMATLYYMMQCDVIMYASDIAHNEPYGRLVVEALAIGKPVVCENRGVFKETLEHGVEALLFTTADEAIDHVNRIRRDNNVAVQLGANAQMWASWQDATVHVGKLKQLLRSIGA